MHLQGFPPIERIAFWSFALLASLVHWITEFPPQVDLAQHAGQLHFMQQWHSPQFSYRDILELNLFTPYLPAYALGLLLYQFLPITVVMKVLWSVAAMGTVVSTVWLRRRIGGDASWDWIAIPGLLGTTFVWGLLTFQLTVPLAIVIIGVWISFCARPTFKLGALMAVGLAVLFFSHALVFGWAVLAVSSMVAIDTVTGRLTPRAALVRALPLIAPAPLVAAWFVLVSGESQAREAINWGVGLNRLLNFLFYWIGPPVTSANAVLGAMFLLVPFACGARLQRRSALNGPLIVTLLIVCFAPTYVLGTGVAAHRFFSFLGPAIVLAFSAVKPEAVSRRPLWLLLPFATAMRIALMAAGIHGLHAEQSQFKRLMQRMAPDKRVLSLVQNPSSEAFAASPWFLHFPVWYQAMKGGIVEFNFASYAYPSLVRFRPEHRSPISPSFAHTPSLEWDGIDASRFDYFVVRTLPDASPPLNHLPLRLISHEGLWWLYEHGEASLRSRAANDGLSDGRPYAVDSSRVPVR